jgi:glycosyltransferase involved in cell wall biosynthesis
VGGIATFAASLADELTLAGQTIRVITVGKSDLPHPYPVTRVEGDFPPSRYTCLRLSMRVARLFIAASRRNSLVILFDPIAHLFCGLALRLLRIPYRLVFNGSEINYLHRSRFLRFVESTVIGGSDRILCISDYTRRLLLARFPRAAKRDIVTSYVPVRTPPLVRSEDSRAEARNVAGLKTDLFVLVQVSRLTERKGHALILEALAMLPRSALARLRYMIVGTGYHETALRTLVERHNLTDYVEFTGEVSNSQLLNLYDAADALVMPSIEHQGKIEGFGIVVIEAARRGVLTIATNHGALPELVQDCHSGLLVSPEPPALAAAIMKLATEPETVQRMGIAAFDRSISTFNARAIARLFTSIS